MSDLFWLSAAQMERLEPCVPKSHGKPRVDDRRVLSGIIFINRNGLRWRDAPMEYGPHKTLYNRWKRWSEKDIFARMMAGLAAGHGEEKTVMIPSRDITA
jgi:transposase